MDKEFFKQSLEKNVTISSCKLDTVFSCSGDVEKDKEHRVCFGSVTERSNGKMDNTYIIWMFKRDVRTYSENSMMFNMGDMTIWIEYVRSIIPFDYKWLTEEEKVRQMIGDDGNDTCEAISVHINGSHFDHMFVLMMLRYIWSKSYEVYLYDAMQLKEMDEYKDCDLLMLYNLVYNTVGWMSVGGDSYEQRFMPGGDDMGHVYDKRMICFPFTTDELRERIKYMKNYCKTDATKCTSKYKDVILVNSIYPDFKEMWSSGKFIKLLKPAFHANIPSDEINFVFSHRYWCEDENSKQLRFALYHNNFVALNECKKDIDVNNYIESTVRTVSYCTRPD